MRSQGQFHFSTYCPNFEKLKVGLCDNFSVCVSLNPRIKFECLNQSLWNSVCISWHRSSSQWRTSSISPISPCSYMYVATQRLCKKCHCGNEYTRNNRIVRHAILYAVRVLSKEYRRLALSRTSYLLNRTWIFHSKSKNLANWSIRNQRP
jgi:hypothetical protein